MTTNETGTKRRTTVRGVWPSAIVENFHEVPEANPRELGAWVYTDQLSYAPGDVIRLHVSTTATAYDLRIYRDGAVETEVCTWQALTGRCHPTPADASLNGCGWPAALEFPVPSEWRSGGYVVHISAAAHGSTRVEHHFRRLHGLPAGTFGIRRHRPLLRRSARGGSESVWL